MSCKECSLVLIICIYSLLHSYRHHKKGCHTIDFINYSKELVFYESDKEDFYLLCDSDRLS